MTRVGTAYVVVEPDTSRFAGDLSRQLGRVAPQAGEGIGQRMGRTMAREMASGMARGFERVEDEAESVGSDAGRRFANRFADNSVQRINEALRRIADSGATVGRQFTEGFTASFRGIGDRLRDAIGDPLGAVRDLLGSIPAVVSSATRLATAASEKVAGAFARRRRDGGGGAASATARGGLGDALGLLGTMIATRLGTRHLRRRDRGGGEGDERRPDVVVPAQRDAAEAATDVADTLVKAAHRIREFEPKWAEGWAAALRPRSGRTETATATATATEAPFNALLTAVDAIRPQIEEANNRLLDIATTSAELPAVFGAGFDRLSEDLAGFDTDTLCACMDRAFNKFMSGGRGGLGLPIGDRELDRLLGDAAREGSLFEKGRATAAEAGLGGIQPKAAYRMRESAAEELRRLGGTLTEMFELPPGGESARYFQEAIRAAMAKEKFGAAVEIKDVEELKKLRLFLAKGGEAGFALKGDDIVSAFRDPKVKRALSTMFPLAIAEGGQRGDAFDPVLPSLYSRFGMGAAARMPWNPEFAPPGWDEPLQGTPDVVFFADPQASMKYQPGQGMTTEDWDEAVRAQDAMILGESGAFGELGKVVRAVGDQIVDAIRKCCPAGTDGGGARFTEPLQQYLEVVDRLDREVADGAKDFRAYQREIAAASADLGDAVETLGDVAEQLQLLATASARMRNISGGEQEDDELLRRLRKWARDLAEQVRVADTDTSTRFLADEMDRVYRKVANWYNGFQGSLDRIEKLLKKLKLDTEERAGPEVEGGEPGSSGGGLDTGAVTAGAAAKFGGVVAGIATGIIGIVTAVQTAMLTALTATLARAFGQGVEFDAAFRRMEAVLGQRGKQAARSAGRIAGEVYAAAWGDSIGQVGDVTARVIRELPKAAAGRNEFGLLELLPLDPVKDAELVERYTSQLFALADLTGEDAGRLAAAARQLVTTGLAADTAAALDLLAYSAQELNDPLQENVDTWIEYSTQFRKLGLDGEYVVGVLDQLVESGAPSLDKAADALKEFSIRAVDGSETTVEAFRTLGLSSDQMAADLAAGGPKAQAAFEQVVRGLQDLYRRNPLAAEQTGVKLFGTQWEDLGASLLSIDPAKIAVQAEGAAQQITDALGSSFSGQWESLKRSFFSGIATALGSDGAIQTTVQTLGTAWGRGFEFTFSGSILGALGAAMATTVQVFKGEMAPETGAQIVAALLTEVLNAVAALFGLADTEGPATEMGRFFEGVFNDPAFRESLETFTLAVNEWFHDDVLPQLTEAGKAAAGALWDGFKQAMWEGYLDVEKWVFSSIPVIGPLLDRFVFDDEEGEGERKRRRRASGGPVSAWTPYLVGEKGPEMFVPRSSGTIVPHSRLPVGVASFRGGQPAVQSTTAWNVTGDFYGVTDPAEMRRQLADRARLAALAGVR